MAIATMRVPTIFTAVDRFSDVVNTMKRNVGSFGEKAESAASRMGDKMTAVGGRMMATSAVMGAMLVKPINDAVKFEDQMDKINTILHLTPLQLKKAGDQVRKFGRGSVNTLDDITESYLDLASIGIVQPKIMPLIKASEKLSVGGIGTMKDAVELLLAKQGAFASEGLTPEQAINQAQKIMKHGKGTLAQLAPSYAEGAVPFGVAGGTSAQYDAMIAGLTTVNQTQATAISQIGLMTRSADKGAGKFKEIFKKLNVKSFADLVRRNKKDILKSFSQILDKGEEMGYNINQIWNRQGASTGVALLLKNQKVINSTTAAYTDILNQANNEADKAYGERSNNRRSQLAKFKNQIEDLSISIGDGLLESLTEFLKQMNPLLKRFSLFLKENPGVVAGFLKIALALGAIGTIVTVGGWMLKIYEFFSWLSKIGWIASLVESFGVTFSMAAGAMGISVGALLWWVLLIIVVIGVLIWIIIDVCQHFEDWKDLLLLMLGPLGWIIYLIKKLGEHWEKIKQAFKTDGILGGIKAIGIMLLDMVLTPLEAILKVASRIPLIDNIAKGLYSGVHALKAEIVPEQSDVTPKEKPKNLAGKSMKTFYDLTNSKVGAPLNGGILSINVNSKGQVEVDDSQVAGIPVTINSTKLPSKKN